jgi:hypothetical protein
MLHDHARKEFVPIYNEKMSLLAIANYNLASQHEFLEEFQAAIIHYELAIQLISNGQ